MRRSSTGAARVCMFLAVVLGVSFISLVIFSPISAIHAGSGLPFEFNEPRSATNAWLGLPVIINNLPPASPTAGILLITEVLYNPLGREPDGEWAELYNAGGASIDLYGYKIGDQPSPGCCEGMLAFPPGTILKPGQIIIVAYKATAFQVVYGFKPDYEMESSDPDVPVLTRYVDWAERGVELTNTGDELLVIGPDNQMVDSVSWGSSKFAFDPSAANVPEGSSLERYLPYIDTDTSRDWRRQISPRPGQVDLSLPTSTPSPIPSPTFKSSPPPTLTPTPFEGKLYLSEFMYDPWMNEPDEEWVEIYNAGPIQLSLQDFKVGDEELRGGNEGMLRFPPGSVISPDHSIVIAVKGTAFFNVFGFLPDYEVTNTMQDLPDMLSYPSWGSSALSLLNQGDELLILDGRDEIIDSVSYGNSAFFFTPSIPLGASGCSLERYPADQDHDNSSDWREQCAPSPGTAAKQPPIFTTTPVPVPHLVINEIHASPDPFLGDANGDGVFDPNGDEFIEIVNSTGVPVNLGGWCLWDERACRHEFPSPSWIADGCSVVIFSAGTPNGLFGGSLVQVSTDGILSLNDTSDTISLYDAAGVLVLSFHYEAGEVRGESLNRWPDITGTGFVPHTSRPEAADKRYSPGTLLDGSVFLGCSSEGR